jgi:mRNA-degrading endonuclease toxin of MazEF toxin-antitoxin module
VAGRLTRGEIWLYRFRTPDKRRPVVVLTRADVIDLLRDVMVAPVSSTIHGLPSEVVIGVQEGMKHRSAVNSTASKLSRKHGSSDRWADWVRRSSATCAVRSRLPLVAVTGEMQIPGIGSRVYASVLASAAKSSAFNSSHATWQLRNCSAGTATARACETHFNDRVQERMPVLEVEHVRLDDFRLAN